MSELFNTVIEVNAELLSIRFPHELPKDPSTPAGEKVKALSLLYITLNKQLPFQAVALHAQNPQILPDLIETLTHYEAETELGVDQIAVVQYALILLRELAGKKLVLKYGPQRKIELK